MILGIDVGATGALAFYDEQELWMPILGYELAYQVSNFGRVKSCERRVKNRWGCRVVKERILKQKKDKDGYKMVELSLESSYKTHKVHHLVLNAFSNPRGKDEVCCHIDGDRNNNFIFNLKWDTQAENIKHRLAHGTELYGEKKPNSIFKNEDIIKIREMAKSDSKKDIANFYGVPTNYITRILNGERYKNV